MFKNVTKPFFFHKINDYPHRHGNESQNWNVHDGPVIFPENVFKMARIPPHAARVILEKF